MDKANFYKSRLYCIRTRRKEGQLAGLTTHQDMFLIYVIINDITGATLVCLIRPMLYISLLFHDVRKVLLTFILKDIN